MRGGGKRGPSNAYDAVAWDTSADAEGDLGGNYEIDLPREVVAAILAHRAGELWQYGGRNKRRPDQSEIVRNRPKSSESSERRGEE